MQISSLFSASASSPMAATPPVVPRTQDKKGDGDGDDGGARAAGAGAGSASVNVSGQVTGQLIHAVA